MACLRPGCGWSTLRRGARLGLLSVVLYASGLTASSGWARSSNCLNSDSTGAQVIPELGLAYRTVAGQALELDAFMPLDACRERPVVIFIHGGGWTSGRKDWLDDLAAQVAAVGDDAFSIDYRLAPAHRFPAQLDDVLAAIRWVQANADRFSADRNRLALFGSSAGGSLAVLAAAVAWRHEITGIRAAVSLSGMLDLPAFLDQNPGWATGTFTEYLGCSYQACPDRYRAASPATFIGRQTPPLFIANSSDELVPLAQATELDAKLTAAGVPHTLLVVPGTGHSTAYIKTAWPQIIGFLQQNLGSSNSDAQGGPQ